MTREQRIDAAVRRYLHKFYGCDTPRAADRLLTDMEFFPQIAGAAVHTIATYFREPPQ